MPKLFRYAFRESLLRRFLILLTMVQTTFAFILPVTAAQSEPDKPVTATIFTTRSLDQSYFGYNAPLTLANMTWTPSVSMAARAYFPTLLRYPGGTLGQYWDWRTGGVMTSNPGTYAADENNQKVSLRDFLATGIGYTGAQPIIVLNMLTSTLKSQLELLRSCRQLGHEIKYAELGNEFYYSPFRYKFATASDYAEEAERWAKAIKQEFPQIKLGVVTAQNEWGPGSWNSTVAAGVPHADALIQHIYPSTGIKDAKISSSNIDAYFASAISTIDGIFTDINSLMSTQKEIWITEFNVYDWATGTGSSEEKESWAHGLFVGEMAERMCANPRVTHAIVHELISSSSHDSILSKSLQPSATGLVFQLIAASYLRCSSISTLNFGAGNDRAGHPRLMGTISTSGHSRRILLMNLSQDSLRVRVDQIISANAKFEQRYAAPSNEITNPSQVTTTNGTLGSVITLPPYSVTFAAEG